MQRDRAAGVIYGLAYGDAWGYLTEFLSLEQIVEKWGPNGPDFPTKALISDDTQMSLAVLTALAPLGSRPRPSSALGSLASAFLDWLHDPDNTRAPGTTCMNALYSLEEAGLGSWTQSTVASSKGCGANMRAPWLGLLGYAEADLIKMAVLQAAITHGHPTGVVSATVTALVVDGLIKAEIDLPFVLPAAIQITERLAQNTPDLSFLGELPNLTCDSVQSYWQMGCTETLAALTKAREQAMTLDYESSPWVFDPSDLGGQGWIAEEALATALLIAQTFANDPVQGLRRAMMTAGDSDSIGAITGSFLGAGAGDVWPASWKDNLEERYATELSAAVQTITNP